MYSLESNNDPNGKRVVIDAVFPSLPPVDAADGAGEAKNDPKKGTFSLVAFVSACNALILKPSLSDVGYVNDMASLTDSMRRIHTGVIPIVALLLDHGLIPNIYVYKLIGRFNWKI